MLVSDLYCPSCRNAKDHKPQDNEICWSCVAMGGAGNYCVAMGGAGNYKESKTHGDQLRAMTDEELAGILAMQGVVSPPWCAENYDCPYADQDPVRCDLCALKWLKQEAGQDARDGP